MGDMWGEMAAAWKEDAYKKQSETTIRGTGRGRGHNRGRGNFRGNRDGFQFRGGGRGNRGQFRGRGGHQNTGNWGHQDLAIRPFRSVVAEGSEEEGEIVDDDDGGGVNVNDGLGDVPRPWQRRGRAFGAKGNPFRPAPKPIVAYCEMCDKEFKDMWKYDQHCSEHTECPAKGCGYKAHFMLMETHFNMVHMAKLPGAEKAWELDTPEKIAEWRAERKKKFPRGDVVEKAREARIQKIKNYNENRRKRDEAEMLKAASAQMKMIEDAPPPVKTVRLSDSRGVRVRTEAGDIVSEDPALGAYLNPVKCEAPVFAGDAQNEQPTFVPKVDTRLDRKLFIPERFINDDPEALSMWPPPSSRKGHHVYSTRPSLIQRLLEQEIWRERTILIQCIEHTVKNNFYEIGTDVTTSTHPT